MLKHFLVIVSFVATACFVAACDSSEDRAQKHFEKGIELLEEGDVDRALVELRNVFQLNGQHREARLTYARVVAERGNLAEAYSQYLRLVEQYPDDLEGRTALAHMAAQSSNWEEAERHLDVAEPLNPTDPVLRSVRIGVTYRQALRSQDARAQADAATAARALLDEDLTLPIAQMVAVESLVRTQDWDGGLALVDQLLEVSQSFNLHRLRVSILDQLGDRDGVTDHLRLMVDLFPDAGLHRSLVDRLIEDGRLADAEAYLRERIETTDQNADDAATQQDAAQPRLELLSFLSRQKGAQAAIDEVDRMLEENPREALILRSLRANLEFDRGNRDLALESMAEITKDAPDSRESDTIKVLYARMLQQMGNQVGARAQVEEVLEHDPGQTGAVKLKSGWLVEDDRPGDALVELRAALDNAPRDPEILTLMAQAHQRAGDHTLMAEMLAMAVEVSGHRKAEALRYAAHLISEEKLFSAEEILVSALRNLPDDPQLLGRLGELYVRTEDWGRARQVISRLDELNLPQSDALVSELTARLLAAQNRAQDLEQFLTQLTEGQSNLGAAAAIIRLHLANGDVEGALQYSTSILAEDPNNPTLRFLQAGVLATEGRLAPAAEILEGLIAEYPQSEQSWLSLYRVQRSLGQREIADATLTGAAEAMPQSVNVKWIQASVAESDGNIDGAIAIYEALYEANSNNAIVANNLASLLASYRDDDESLRRAYVVARRLRNASQPAFMDTYGWIATRLGNLQEGLKYLEPAAKELANDPVVQYHLAETYRQLLRDQDALPYYMRVVALVDAGANTPPFMDQVTAEIARISALQ